MKTKCRHYSSPIHNNTCSVGVNYRQLGDDSKPGYLVRLPCVVGSPLTKEPVACEKISVYNEEELKQIENEITKRSEMTIKAVVEIRKTKLQSGEIKCPICECKLSFSIAKSNCHIWAKCVTKDFISFIS